MPVWIDKRDGYKFFYCELTSEVELAPPSGVVLSDDGEITVTYYKRFTQESVILGVLHNNLGPAVISGLTSTGTNPQLFYWYLGKHYKTRSEWFEVLTSEEKRAVIWNIDAETNY